MYKLVIAQSFLEDLADLPENVIDAMWAELGVISEFPGVGSSLLEPYFRNSYGPQCLKVAVCGYDVLYRRRDDQGEIHVLGVVPQRCVR